MSTTAQEHGTTAATTGRAPLLAPRPRTASIGPIAVDFGTSSSTVTMYDGIDTRDRVLWPGQAAIVARGLAALLRRADWPDRDAPRRMTETFRSSLTDKIAGFGTDDPEALARQLDDDARLEERLSADRYMNEDDSARQLREQRLLEAVHRFEHEVTDPRLRPWLAGQLHAVYREALTAPAPEAYLLTPVHLDLAPPIEVGGGAALGGRDIPSRLVVGPGDDITSARLQQVTSGAASEWVGIKRFLSARRPVDELQNRTLPRGWSGDSELLLGLCYRDLVGRTHEYLDELAASRNKPVYRARRVDQVTVTFPTITPPAARVALQELVADALALRVDDVDVSYDEAIAASLYFVQRELGGDRRGGVDALRARSRLLPDGARRRTMLVIDIGGGTTDIALLALDLAEKQQDGPPDPFGGRHYELAPKVLGTTGHQQLGGDLLTLRVFYWIKALIVDALTGTAGMPAPADLWPSEVVGGAVPDLLAPLVVDFGSHEAPAPSAVREVLRGLVPTHTDREGASAQSEAFRKIWQEAERAKRHLSDGQDVTLTAEWLIELRTTLKCDWAEAVGTLGDRITLPADDFRTLARPVFEHAMTLAARLVRRRLANSPDPVLDVVALAGRSCGGTGGRTGRPLAEQVAADTVGDTLVDGSSGQQLVRWNTTSIVVELHNAKQAASIGAAWAHSRKQHETADNDIALRNGDDLIDFTVDNLLLQMPCGFAVRGVDTTIPLFEIGEPFDETRHDGTRFRSSRWMPVPRTLDLLRRIEDGRDIRWGMFRYSAYSDPPPDVRYRVEMDQRLRPRLLLRRGAEDHRMVSPACAPFELGRYLRSTSGPEGLARVPRIEAVLVGGDAEPVVLFDGGGDLDQWLHVDDDPAAWGRGVVPEPPRPVRGITSRTTLPAVPSAKLSYRLRTLDQRGEPTDIGDVVVPRHDVALTDRYWVALDVHGRLLVLRDEPLLLQAGDIREMEKMYGSTFVTDMNDFVPDWDPIRDPYSGVH